MDIEAEVKLVKRYQAGVKMGVKVEIKVEVNAGVKVDVKLNIQTEDVQAKLLV